LNTEDISPILGTGSLDSHLLGFLIFQLEEHAMTKTPVKRNSKVSLEIANCRAVDIGISGFAECLLSGPKPCSYAVPFGYCFLCKHPHLDDIIANTKKIQPAVAVLK
jgi:hypothetical protein